MLQNIPAELRQLPRWVVAGPNRLPLNPRTGQAADVTNPSSWATFDEALRSGYKHVGFVLHEPDGLSIIDLDNKADRPASPEQLARHQRILELFDSYTERSTSGRGYHIIVKGKVPTGAHRDNVEVYSASRYMICTGDVVRQAPIADYQDLLLELHREITAGSKAAALEEVGDTLEDQELVDMAMRAANGDKFTDLCNGLWQEMGYPSQSEADFALLSIFAFYSQSNEQCRRLFRYSKLGQREKAQRNDRYLNYALSKIRGKEPPRIDFEALALPPKPPLPQDLQPQPPKVAEGYDLPPGLVGEMAYYFYQTAVRPVPDIALAAAIGLTAGVAGRSYNISGTGLNQYLVLIAKTGAGKEGAAKGINNLVAAVRPVVPMVDQFIGPAAFASGQALIKVLDQAPCFVSVLGEFGLTLQHLCDPQANSAQIVLRKVLLDLYTKSGWTDVLRSSVYSDTEKNTKVVQAPNVTILGESTPEAFFEGLDASHISEGLIPRFSLIQYIGPRPDRNPNANQPPPPQLIQRFADLVTVALTTANNNTCAPVSTSPEAQAVLDAFDKESDSRINNAHQDVVAQIWNRAHLKALKLSALLAVGCDPHNPVVTAELAEWAIKFVRRDVGMMSERYESGDVGHGDTKQLAEVTRVVRDYLAMTKQSMSKWGVDSAAQQARIIPYWYVSKRCLGLAAFKGDRRGATPSLKLAIQNLVDSGLLVECQNKTGAKGWKIS